MALLSQLRQALRSGAELPAAQEAGVRSIASYTFASLQDAPSSSLSKAISVTAKPADVKGKKGVEVSCTAGSATVRAKYAAADMSKLAASPTQLHDVARISVLHSSLMEYLLRLAHERYSILAQFPDFSTMFGKDYYYRAHPDDLKKFYAAADEFHRMWEVVTEFDSLSNLATELVPSYRSRRMNVVHPAIGPNVANAAVTQFLLAQAK